MRELPNHLCLGSAGITFASPPPRARPPTFRWSRRGPSSAPHRCFDLRDRRHHLVDADSSQPRDGVMPALPVEADDVLSRPLRGPRERYDSVGSPTTSILRPDSGNSALATSPRRIGLLSNYERDRRNRRIHPRAESPPPQSSPHDPLVSHAPRPYRNSSILEPQTTAARIDVRVDDHPRPAAGPPRRREPRSLTGGVLHIPERRQLRHATKTSTHLALGGDGISRAASRSEWRRTLGRDWSLEVAETAATPVTPSGRGAPRVVGYLIRIVTAPCLNGGTFVPFVPPPGGDARAPFEREWGMRTRPD